MPRMHSIFSFAFILFAVSAGSAQEQPRLLPKPDDKPGAADKPVKVFILMGQSNMVGMGTSVRRRRRGRSSTSRQRTRNTLG